MSTGPDERKHPLDGNREQSAKLRKLPPTSTDNARPSSTSRSYASAAADDAASRRHGENQSATRPGKGGDPSKLEQKLAKQPPENHIPSSASEPEELHERVVDPQPPATESTSRKRPTSTVDPTQHMRRGSIRSSTSQLPAGAAVPHRFDSPRQESQTSGATIDSTTSTSNRGSKASNTKPGDAPAATLPPDPQPEVDTEGVDKGSGKRTSNSDVSKREQAQNAATTEGRRKSSPDADQDEDSGTHSDSETTSLTHPVAQDGSGLTSGVLGGIATALGMRPPTAREVRLEGDNRKLKQENKFLRAEFHNAQMAARKYHHDAFRFHHENVRLTETLEALSLEIKGVTKRYEEAKSLSDTRGKELIGAQVFLTKADGLSISELIQKVDALNDEIYQAAASLGESIVQKQVDPSDQAHYSSDEGAIAKSLLGSPLCKVLRSCARKFDEGANPLLVQIALQAFFSMFCIQRIRCWIPSHLAFDAALRELYEKIWSSSDQAVSGRWRSLTRAQLKPDANTWTKELTTDLDAILAFASWAISSPDDRHTLEARLPAIFKVVLDVREAIGEKFTSADIEVNYVEPNSPFSEVYMEEIYAAGSEGHEKEPEIVIATVGMGVRKVVTVKEGLGYEYVLSPKVVLESSLKAVLEPPPPRSSRSKSTRRP